MASNDIMIKVGADVGRAINQLNRVTTAAQKMGDSGGKSSNKFTGKLNTLSAGLKRTSLRMAPISALAGGLFARAIKSSAEFSQKMAVVGAIAGANKKQMGQLRDAAKDMGSSSIFSINEVADGMQGLAEQGYTTAEVIKTMPSALNLAQGSAAKLADSTMLLAVATNIYGKGTYSAAHLSDVFTKSANTSAASVEYLQTAFQYSAQPAKTLGVGIEDLTAVTGILANKGQKASRAGTMMGQVFARLAKPTDASQQALDQLGISAFDSQGKFVGLSKFVGEYAEATKGMTQQQKLATAKTIFGQRAMTAWQDLVDAGAGKIDKYSDSLEHSGGAAQKAADKANNNLGAALENLKDSFVNLSDSLMQSVDGPLRKFIKWLDDMVDKLSNMDSSKLQAVVMALAGIAAVAPLLGILAMIVSGISAIITIAGFAIPIVVALWTALTAPVTLIIAALVAIVVGIKYFFTQTKVGKKLWSDFMNWLENLWFLFSTFIGVIAKQIGKKWSELVDWLSTLWGAFVVFMEGLWTVIKNAGQSAAEALKNVWQGIKDWFSELWQGIVDVFTNAWNTIVQDVLAIIQAIKDAWNATIEFFTTLWQGIVDVAKTIWQGLVEFFTGLIEGVVNIWNGLVEFFTNLWNSILEVTTNVWNTITTTLSTIIQTIFEFISNIFTSIGTFISNTWNTIVTVTTTIWNTISNAVTTGATNAWNWLVNVWNAIPGWVSGLWNGVVSLVTSLWNTISSAVSNGAKNAWNWLKSAWSGITGWVSNLWNKVKSVVSNLWNAISSAVSNGARKAFNWLKNIWNGITGWVSGLWNGVKSTVSNIWNGISSTVSRMAHNAFSGLRGAWSGLKSWVSGIWNGVKDAIHAAMNFDLGAAGQAIMNSFLGGLKRAWGAVKKFVGGIGSWIKAHKGPISYDKRLLIPAGKAIMHGLDKGLNNQYKSVMNTVSGVAGNIEDAMSLSPTVDLGTGVSDVKSQLGVDVSNEVAVQPANIKLNLGSTSYEAFVNDISQQQGRSARLKKSNTVR